MTTPPTDPNDHLHNRKLLEGLRRLLRAIHRHRRKGKRLTILTPNQKVRNSDPHQHQPEDRQ